MKKRWDCNIVPCLQKFLGLFKPVMDINDWRLGKSWAERYLYMLENKIGCDVTFCLMGDKKIEAHKFVLISRSAVFEAMFCNSLAEKTSSKSIQVPDIDVDIFNTFLRYLYASDITLDDHNKLPVLYVARKYCVEDLVQLCADYLRSRMTPETVCEVLEQAHTYDIDDLKNMCLQYIFENGNSVLTSDSFTDLCYDCVKLIVQSNDLFVEESDVYTALTSWATRECARRNMEAVAPNKRQVLGKLLFKIRFPTMDKLFFTDVVSADDILTDSEKIMMFQHMFGSSPKDDLPFTEIKREAKVIKCLRFPCNEQGDICCEPGFKNSNFGIDVRASDDVMLQGLMLFGACSTSTQSNQSDSVMTSSIPDQHMRIVISAIPHSTQPEVYQFEFDNIEIPQDKTYSLFLKEPVLLKKGKMYAIQVKLDLFLPYQTFSGTGGLAEVDSGSVKFSFFTHQSLVATTVERGQIAGLLFSKLPDPERVENSISPRGSPVKREFTREDVKQPPPSVKQSLW